MRIAIVFAIVVAALLLAAEPAAACSTCFGAQDSALTKGMNKGIVALLGVIGVVQVGFVAMFASFVIRTRRLRERKNRFRLIHGGTR